MIDWEKLEQCAKQVCNPRQLSKNSYAASVGAAIVTDRGNIYTGVCIDLPCGLGFCAEQAAAAEMLKHGETKIRRILAVNAEGRVLPPCGRCREFISQLDAENLHTLATVDEERAVPLERLLPERWDERK